MFKNTSNLLFALVALLASDVAAESRLTTFIIDAGSEVTYFPYQEGPGIPGCSPSDSECVFEIAGELIFQESLVGPHEAKLIDARLDLFGNEAVLSSLGFGLTTADRIEDWLLDQSMGAIDVLVAGPGTGRPDVFYEKSTGFFQFGARLFSLPGEDFNVPRRHLELLGGYNEAPRDGDGIDFRLTATAIPEPTSLLLALAVGLVTRPRTPRRSRGPSGR